MPATRIFLCRHGETDWNREGRYQGFQDIPLNERGKRQAGELATFLRDVPIDAAYSSNLSRANQTACAVMRVKGLSDESVVQRAGLAEISHGSWEGKLASDAQASDPKLLERWVNAPHQVAWPEGDSLEVLQARAVPEFEKIVREHPDQSVLIAAHDAVNKVLLLWAAAAPLSQFWTFKQDSTCLNVLDVTLDKNGRLKPTIVLMNSVAHTGRIFGELVHKAL